MSGSEPKPTAPPYDYARVRITGALTNRTELRIGSGYEAELPRPEGEEEAAEAVLYATLFIDAYGDPCIPGSTLRGYLSQALKRDPDRHRRLIGTARLGKSAGNDEDAGNAGALRVYDARWPGGGQRLRSRVAIDPVTGTAAARKLYTEAVVPAGGAFQVRIEMDRVDRDDIAAVLAALSGFNHRVALDAGGGRKRSVAAGDAALGQGKSHGRGKLRWHSERVEAITSAALRDWLTGEGSLEERFEPLEDVDLERFLFAPAEGSFPFYFRLVPLAPLLVDDPHSRSSKKEKPDAPDLQCMRSDERVLVPGSSLKGLLRARCRKIALTLLAARAGADATGLEDKAEEVVNEIFGSTQRAARIEIGDASARYGIQRHRQFFNAVDRFTGGVKEGALYNVEAVWPRALFCRVRVSPEIKKDENLWMLGLLALALRDAMEGDLAFGWGKGRGYGAFRAEVLLPGSSAPRGWKTLMEDFERREDLVGHVQALEEYLAGKIQELRSEAERAAEEARRNDEAEVCTDEVP